MRAVRGGFCCCRFCKGVFDSEAEFLGHLSVDESCRGGADRIVLEVSWCVLGWRRRARKRARF